MSRKLVIVTLTLALGLGLGLAAPAPAFMPDPLQDPAPPPWPGQECPPGLYWSHQYNQCISGEGPAGPPVMPPHGIGEPPPEGCPPGLRWSSRQLRCVPGTTWSDCGPHQRWSGRWQRCLPLCPPGTYYDQGLGNCLAAPPGYVD